MPRSAPEQTLQRAVAAYLDAALPSDAVWTAINPVPAKSRAAAGISKAMGLKAGFLDLLILWRTNAYLIELKAKGGRVSPDQVVMIRRLSDAGAHCAVCHEMDDVIDHLNAWGFPLKARIAA